MKPILFNTEMVRAILDGRKTVTRRVIKPQPTNPRYNIIGWLGWDDGHGYKMRQPYCPGDILYVRETWCYPSGTEYPFLYKADMPMHWDAEDTEIGVPIDLRAEDYTWRPSIHMPKEAARLFLRVTNVSVARLQDMRLADCLKEGVQLSPTEQVDLILQSVRARDRFSGVWNSTIKKADLPRYGWDANPWVWVIEFERISKEEAQKGGEE